LKTSAIVDVAILDRSSKMVRQLTHEKAEDHRWQPVAWSRDGRYVLATRTNVARTDSSVYRIEIASGKLQELTPHTGQMIYTASSLSPDGKTALVGSNEKRGFGNVALLDVASHKLTWVTDLQWDAQPGDFSPKGDRFTYL